MHWEKAGGDQATFQRDGAECEYEAAAATANYGSGPSTSRTTGGAIGEGLAAGYGHAMQERQLIQLCMRAKGYTAVAGAGPNASPVASGSAPVAPAMQASPTVVMKPGESERTPERMVAAIEYLIPHGTTIQDAKVLLGTPTSQTYIGANLTLLQWLRQDGGKLATLALVFNDGGVLQRIQSQTRIGF